MSSVNGRMASCGLHPSLLREAIHTSHVRPSMAPAALDVDPAALRPGWRALTVTFQTDGGFESYDQWAHLLGYRHEERIDLCDRERAVFEILLEVSFFLWQGETATARVTTDAGLSRAYSKDSETTQRSGESQESLRRWLHGRNAAR